MRGAMFERQKKVEAAEAEFRKVLAAQPGDTAGALNYLGYMLVDHKMRVDEATQMIKKALDADPENGAYLDSLGWAYYQQGKFDEAEGAADSRASTGSGRTRRFTTTWATCTSNSARSRKPSPSGRRR